MNLGQRWTRVVLPASSLAALLVTALYWSTVASRPLTPAIPTTPEAALAELRKGNTRFVSSARTNSTDTSHDAELRRQTAQQQHPIAVILCCSDSRVCPEFIFDQRSGSIFEIRNAGNVVDEDVLASFEYAVEHLRVPLMLVLAHKGCGAIEAVCQAGEEPLHDHLQELQKHMEAIRQQSIRSHDDCTPEVLNRFSRQNAIQQAITLVHESQMLKGALQAGRVRLMCGLYDMKTGAVEFFDPQ